MSFINELPASVLAALCFAPLFIIVLTIRPHWFVWLAFAGTPYQMSLLGGLGGIQGGIVDVLAIFLCLPLLLALLSRPINWNRLSIYVLLFLGICTLASVWNSFAPADAVSIIRMGMITIVPLLIFQNLELPQDWEFACINAYLTATVVLVGFQLVAFLQDGYVAAFYVLGLHKNFIGIIMGTAVGITTALLLSDSIRKFNRLWLYTVLAICSTGLVLSLSRGAWLATCSGIALLALFIGRIRSLLAGSFVVALTVLFVWGFLPKEATTYATDISPESHNISSRFEMMETVMAVFQQNPFLGSGVDLRKQIDPHNVIVLTLGETGLIGLVAFLTMFGSGFLLLRKLWLAAPDEARPLVLAATATFTIAFSHGLFDVYWRRGVAFISWGLIGIAYVRVVLDSHRTDFQAPSSEHTARLYSNAGSSPS